MCIRVAVAAQRGIGSPSGDRNVDVAACVVGVVTTMSDDDDPKPKSRVSFGDVKEGEAPASTNLNISGVAQVASETYGCGSLGSSATEKDATTTSTPSDATASKKPSPSMRIARAKFVHCADCGRDIPADEWPNHRDRLRTVELKQQTKSLVQRYILTPILNFVMWVLVTIFFREVAVVGKENIPKGPVVFYGNHQNQFIDAMIMRAHCGRSVRFIIAAKSMQRPVIGHFARLMEAVPVVRPQDVPSMQGKGKILCSESNTVRGEGTTFLSDVNIGDVVIWNVPSKKENCSGQVLTVVSDTELKLTRPVADGDQMRTARNYKISRRIDHSEMYAEVYDTLSTGKSIGIFPEGGSHDNTSLVPLKAGVALFTLGASERGVSPKIVPCGLTYFYGHKFRSRAHIEFGKPITAPEELVTLFASDKRKATGEMLKLLDDKLRSVTINVPDWSTLKFLHNFRRLYQPPGLLLDTGDYLRLTRRLALITTQNTDHPDFAEFRTKVENYSDFCNALLVRDSQAATLSSLVENHGQAAVSLRLLFRRIAILCVLTVVLLPFFVVGGPVGVACHVLAEAHAKTALSASSVKVVAADVKASYKMVLGFGLVPLEFGLVSLFVYAWTDLRTALTFFFSLPVVMYVSLVLVREWVMEGRAALPLIMSILSKHKQFLKLHDRRCTLVAMAKTVVHKFDPELEDELAAYTSAVGPAKQCRQASLFSLRHQSRAVRKKRL